MIAGVPLEALWPAALLAGFVLLLGLALAYELGANGAWARNRRASHDLLRDVEERRAARELYPTVGRTVLGTPRDWSDQA